MVDPLRRPLRFHLGSIVKTNFHVRARLRDERNGTVHFALTRGVFADHTLWARTTKNTDWGTGPLPRPFARSRPPLRSLVRALRCAHSFARLPTSLTPFAHSLAHETVNDWMAIFSVFFFSFWPVVARCFPLSGRSRL